MAVVITQTANPSGAAASSNVSTYSGVSIGTAAANRIVVVLVGSEVTNGTINSCTIDYGSGDTAMSAGTAATQGIVRARAFYLAVPTGTTATIKVTYGASPTGTQNHIAVYSVTGAAISSVGGHNSTDMDANAPLTTGSISIASGGGFLAVAVGATDTVGKTWGNATEDIDADAGSHRFTTATRTTELTTTAITCTGGTNGEDGAMSWIIFTANASPTVALNTPTDTATITDTTPDLVFTGTDSNNDAIRYNIQVATNTSFSDTVVYDNSTLSGVADSGAVRTFSHTVGDYDDRCLIVATAARGAVTVSSATYNGDALSKIDHQQLDGDERVELWYLLTPDTGTHDVVVTFSATQNIGVVAASYYNVDSIGNDNGNVDSAVTTSSVTMTNTAGHAIVDILGLQTGSFTPDGAPTAGQVERHEDGAANMVLYYGDKLNATSNNTMGWSFGNNYYAELCAVLVPKYTTGVLVNAVSGTDAGFSGSPDNSDPFASAQAVTYTVQSVLDPNTTYYWRVRGTDPFGSIEYGAWTVARSFTVAMSGNSERTLYTKGKDSTNSEQSLYTQGFLTANSERGLYAIGQVLENSERGLYTKGQDSTSSERGLYTIGSTLANSERGLYTKGVASIESERGLYTAGKASTNSERGLYTTGVDSTNSERGFYVTGTASTSSERGLYTEGSVLANSERELYLAGEATASSERKLYLLAENQASSNRGLYTEGNSSIEFSERGLYIEGAQTDTSERNLYTTGNVLASSERGLYTIGNIQENSERSVYATGEANESSERGIYITGGVLADSERGLYTEGASDTNRYWIGGTGNWNDTAHWSYTSGGSGGAPVPDYEKAVDFDANSFTANGQTVTVDGDSYIEVGSMDWSGITYTATFEQNTNSLYVYGDFILSSSLTWSDANVHTIYLEDVSSTTGTTQIDFAGIDLHADIRIRGSATWTYELLSDFINTAGNNNTYFYFYQGTINTNGYDMYLPISSDIYAGTLNLSTSTIHGGQYTSFDSPMVVNGGSSTLIIPAGPAASSYASSFESGAITGTFGEIRFENTQGQTYLGMDGDFTAVSVYMAPGADIDVYSQSVSLTATNWTISGESGNPVTILNGYDTSARVGSTSQTYVQVIGGTGDRKVAQSFQLGISAPLNRIRFNMKRVGSTTDYSVKASVYTDNGGEPGSLLWTGDYTSASITTLYDWSGYTLTLDMDVPLVASTTYWLTLEQSGGTLSDDNYCQTWAGGGASDPYASGVALSSTGGGAWGSLATELSITYADITNIHVYTKDQFIFEKTTGSITANYLDIGGSNVGGGATWTAGTGFVDSGNNTGWIRENSSERGLYMTGVLAEGSERALWVNAITPESSERGLYIAGVDTTRSERTLHTIGSVGANSERGLYITGSTPINSERTLYTKGVDTNSSERGLYIQGSIIDASERGLYAKGSVATSSERGLHIQGSTTDASERTLYAQGQIGTDSERGLYVNGGIEEGSERGLYISGQGSETSERTLYTQGQTTGNSERGLYATGGVEEDSERGLYIKGSENVTLYIDYFEIDFYKETSNNRSLYMEGGVAGESERGLYIHGGIEEDSERGLYIDCVEGSMRNMWLRGLDPFEDSDAIPGSFTDTDDAITSSWVDTDDTTTSSWVDMDITPGSFTDTTTTTGGFVDIS